MKNRNKIEFLFLGLLSLIAFIIRVYKLGSSPEALTWDEAALGYNAYTILKTGADEYGYKLPLVLRSFDDYKPALYAYLAIPFIKLFGFNITAIRLVSALAGTSLVISIYFLGRIITGRKKVGILAAVLTVTSPILLLYSRIALEANLSLALFISGLCFTLKKNSLKSFIFGCCLLLLSTHAYHSPRYVVPIVFIISLTLSLKKESIKRKIILSIIFIVLYLPILYFTFNPRFNRRFQETSIITKRSVLVGSLIQLDNTNYFFDKLSRGYFYLLDISGRYLGYFNPYMVFVKASGHESYHVDGLGVLNLFEIPLWLIGIYLLFKNHKKNHPVLPVVIIIAALPAAMTTDWFMPLRALLIWPMYLIISAMGGIYLWKNKYKTVKHLLFLMTLVVLWSYHSARIIETVIFYQPYIHAGAYQYGFAQMVPYIDNLIKTKNYNQVIIDSPHAQPHIFFLTFSSYPPEKYQKEIQWRVNDFTPRLNFDFGPYTFREINWIEDKNLNNTLFVGDIISLPYDQIEHTPNATILNEFKSPDGNISFRVIENR